MARSWRRRLPPLLALLVIVGVIAYRMWPERYLPADESVNLLIVGIEGVVMYEQSPAVPEESWPKATTVALLSLHVGERRAHLLLIPTDFPVPPDPNDPFAPYTEERPLYYLVDVIGAPSLAGVIQELLDVPVHATLRTDVLSLQTLVHRTGGLYLPEDLAAVDLQQVMQGPWDMEPVGEVGYRLYSGEEVAAAVLWDAYQDGRSRLAVQAAVFRAALQKLRSGDRMVHMESLFERAWRFFETDLAEEVLLAITEHLHGVPSGNIHMALLPGEFTPEGFVVDRVAAREMAQRVYVHKERPSERQRED